MADDRAFAALRRIEAALARVEDAASRPAPAADSTAAVDGEELERLRSAHQLLRQRVTGAIGQIDQLLQTGQQS